MTDKRDAVTRFFHEHGHHIDFVTTGNDSFLSVESGDYFCHFYDLPARLYLLYPFAVDVIIG